MIDSFSATSDIHQMLNDSQRILLKIFLPFFSSSLCHKGNLMEDNSLDVNLIIFHRTAQGELKTEFFYKDIAKSERGMGESLNVTEG